MEIVEELSATVGRTEVITSVEQAASLAASQTAGRALRVRLDPENGNLACFASKRVVEEVNDPEAEVLFSAAPEGVEVGEMAEVPAPLRAAVRSAARAGREVLDARLRGGKLLAQAERYRSRIGKLETATVKRREGGDLIVDLGPVEGRIPTREQSRHEVFNPEDTVRASVVAVEADEPPVILSRIRPELVAGVIERETPEVRQGTVEVRAAARRPGLRAKAAVWSGVRGVNPVAACLGPGGARIRAVSRELRGERVDVVLWSDSPERFARNALRPAEILGIRAAKPGEIAVRPASGPPWDRGSDRRSDGRSDRRSDNRSDNRGDRRRGPERGGPPGRERRGPRSDDSQGRSGAETGGGEFPFGLVVTVSAEELPRALGKKGQNVRLASELVGIPIEVVEEGGSPRPPPASGRPGQGSDRRGERGSERRPGSRRDSGEEPRGRGRRPGERPWKRPWEKDANRPGGPPRRSPDGRKRGAGRPPGAGSPGRRPHSPKPDRRRSDGAPPPAMPPVTPEATPEEGR